MARATFDNAMAQTNAAVVSGVAGSRIKVMRAELMVPAGQTANLHEETTGTVILRARDAKAELSKPQGDTPYTLPEDKDLEVTSSGAVAVNVDYDLIPV